MASFKVAKDTFTLIPEGTYIFKVTKCEDEYEDDGIVEYTLQAASGQTIRNRFNFVDGLGEVNEIAAYYWSKFARAALNLSPDDEPEIDFSDLVDCYVKAEVEHNTYTVKSGKHKGEERTGANIVDKTYEPATGFDKPEEPDADDSDEWDDF